MNQLQRILNIDKSEVSTDGTTKLVGGRPSMKMSSTNSKISGGATQANKSSYHATFVGGSNMAGWLVPPHFQMQSDTTATD